MDRRDKVLVVDFGGQYSHLIARRIRELGVYSEIVPLRDLSRELVEELKPKGIILSGGPSSVLEEDSPKAPGWILELGVPILGICYGHQLLAQMLGGSVARGRGEYGRTRVRLVAMDPLLKGLEEVEEVWMSHRDYVEKVPTNAGILAVSVDTGYVAAFRLKDRPVYGLQFHPEVSHTRRGKTILDNFLQITGAERSWRAGDMVERIIREIRETVGDDGKVLCAVSGGVDSTVTAVLIKRALGDRLVAVFVNHGLMREGEVEEVINNLKSVGIEPLYVDASELFVRSLEGVSDAEEKRKIIGKLFADVFRKIIERDPSIKWLAQGTTYPDIVESGSRPHSAKIKTHHNVGGLPSDLGLKLIEPLREFYKDEVREIGRSIGIPEEILRRHPFPGPGLAVRIIGEVTREKLSIVRKASLIIDEEIKKAGLYDKLWQAFPVLTESRWVGVTGDSRREGYVLIVRAVESEDGMTADWARLPYEVLEKISVRLTSEIPEITMGAYAVTSKPPSTIEAQ
ncbi:MAG: glutamine-hydrolyzing GMP synthase [Fervidicoccaceae archaeon]